VALDDDRVAVDLYPPGERYDGHASAILERTQG
jgi:hypothetical protein